MLIKQPYAIKSAIQNAFLTSMITAIKPDHTSDNHFEQDEEPIPCKIENHMPGSLPIKIK